MSSTTTGAVAVAVLVPTVALTTIAYAPFGRPGCGVNASVCDPFGFAAVNSVARPAPACEMRLIVTIAAVGNVTINLVSPAGAVLATLLTAAKPKGSTAWRERRRPVKRG